MPLEVADRYVEETAEGSDKEFLWTLNFGPQHPATHTTLRLILTLDGERVADASPAAVAASAAALRAAHAQAGQA